MRAAGIASLAAVLLWSATGHAQSTTNLAAFAGLAPVTALDNSEAGKAALAANLTATGAVQDGSAHQPTLLPFPEQQEQALRDATITSANASELADGLGSRLGAAYRAKAATTSDDGGKTVLDTNISSAVADLLGYAMRTSYSDSAASKFFFAAGLGPDGKPASAEAAAILTRVNGKPDIFGRAYGLPAGTPGGNPRGNPRPFQTEPHTVIFRGTSFFGVPTHSIAYLSGPAQDLRASSSFPSGHTTYGYTESLLLALLVPERYSQMVVRAAEYGNSRIILGAHYVMDVLAGRTLAAYDLAHLLGNAPGYVGVDRGGLKIADFRKALAAARSDVTRALEAGCGAKITACANDDHSRFAEPGRNRAFYVTTQTYGLPVVYPDNTAPEDVGKRAPEAGYLLTAAFPYLTLAQANAILTATEGPGGGFLDNGTAFGIYSRLDLLRAAKQAAALRK